MRARLLVAVAALALWPAAAWAVVEVRVERIDLVPNGRDQVVTFEVFASNPDAAENERLNAFTIMLQAPTFRASGPAPRFVIPDADQMTADIRFDVPTAHPYVFGDYPGNGPVDPVGMSDFDTVLLSAALGGAGQEANISDVRNGFAKVSVLIPAGTPLGSYPINLDPSFLSLGGAGGPIVAVSVPGGGWFATPEPAAPGVLAPLGLMALRRRRAASAGDGRHGARTPRQSAAR